MAEKVAAPSALITAIRSAQVGALILALDQGADIEEADIHGATGLPLRTACFGGNLDIVHELVRRGADLNAVGSDGPGAPLRLASRCGHRHIVAFLIAQGAEIPAGLILPTEVVQPDRLENPPVEQPPLEFTSSGAQSLSQALSAVENRNETEEITAPIEDSPAANLVHEFHESVTVIDSPVTLADPEYDEPEESQPKAKTVFPDGHLIEEVDVGACYGTDTNLLGLDLLRLSEEAERAKSPPPPPSTPKGFWTTNRKKD